jgi:hypothetical protein
MCAKLTRLTHKIAIQLHLVAESCTICSSRSRRPVRKLLDTPSYKQSLLQTAFTKVKFKCGLFPNPQIHCSFISTYLIFLFCRNLGNIVSIVTTASRPALGPTQSPIQWVPGALSLGVKRQGREADHSPPSSAEVKERVELYLHSPSTPSWRSA